MSTSPAIGRGKADLDVLMAVLFWPSMPALAKFALGASDGLTIPINNKTIDLGCYFSINAEMLRKERHRDLVTSLPLNRILTETA